MDILSPLTTTLKLHIFRGDQLIAQWNQSRRGTNAAPLSINCSKPKSTGFDSVAPLPNRESRAKREILSRAAKAAAVKTKEKGLESDTETDWDLYCDVLPDSHRCQTLLNLTLSPWQMGEVKEDSSRSDLAKLGSKKRLRLSFTSTDLLE